MHGAAGGAAASLERVDGGVGGGWGGGDFEGSEDYTVAVLCCAVLA